MEKMWAGRFEQELAKEANDFNSSIHFDCRMYQQDIEGSMAHAAMLGKQQIITAEDASLIIEELGKILENIKTGALSFDMECEDIHMFIEKILTERIGEVGKKLHTARSRNDQVTLDLRMYLRDEVADIAGKLKKLAEILCAKAEQYKETIMPGYTHLQRAQPITFGHHLMAYAMMFVRDIDRFQDAANRMNVSPIGCCALAGTTYDTDRVWEAERLGFDAIVQNSLDGVSDRDYCVEILNAIATCMMHMSRFSEELILWSSWEFQFIELSDAYTTGSSIMPQKKNSDMAELVRGKCGRVYGNLMATLTMLKGLPLAYNKDMQEDKEAVFDSVDTIKMCLDIFAPMIDTMSVKEMNMLKAAKEGFINATDLADYLVKKGTSFRTAYKLVGSIVGKCIKEHKVLDNLTLDEYQEYSELFGEDLYDAISLKTCVEKRTSEGGTSPASVSKQIKAVMEYLTK